MSSHRIRPLAICVFHRDGRILVNKANDVAKGQAFYRPLGGGVEFGELSADTVRREIREELDKEVRDLRLLGALENLFTFAGRPGHEIVFVYDGSFTDESVYQQSLLHGEETGGSKIRAEWRGGEHFTSETPLYPSGLAALLQSFGLLRAGGA